MFEETPKPEEPVIAGPQAVPNAAGAVPITVPQAELNQDMMMLMKRDGLTTVQKIILLLVAVLVVGGLIAGGLWLYAVLDPLNGGITIPNFTSTTYSVTDQAAADDDNDGLRNLEEAKYSTNPTVADTDGDGLLDGEEVKTYHTNPVMTDTDGDGLDDRAEVIQYHSDPTMVDTDGDGYLDGNEVTNGYNPIGPGKL